MVDFGTAGLLAGHHLSSVPAAEALVLPLLGHHHLLLPLAVAPPLPALVLGRRVVLGDESTSLVRRRRCRGNRPFHGWKEGGYLRPDAQEAAAVRSAALTDGLPVSQTFQVVVEGEFRA